MKTKAIAAILELYLADRILFKNLVEFSLLLTNRKQVVRLVGNVDLFMDLQRLASVINFTISKSPFMLETVRSTNLGDQFQISTEWNDSKDNDFVIYLGGEDAVLRAIEIESGDCSAEDTASVYGYPPCCATNYQLISDGKNWIEALLGNSTELWYDYRANKISSLFPPYLSLHQDYFPCSLDCVGSLEKCRSAEQSLKECDLAEMLPHIKDHLSGIFVLYDQTLWFARKYLYDSVCTTFSDFHSTGFIDLSDRGRTPLPPYSIVLSGEQFSINFADGGTSSQNMKSGARLVIFH
jgi:hypothetical protein